jgi:hypothetical protein
MGTGKVAFAEVLWGATGSHVTGSDVTGSDVSHVTGKDISHVPCPETGGLLVPSCLYWHGVFTWSLPLLVIY